MRHGTTASVAAEDVHEKKKQDTAKAASGKGGFVSVMPSGQRARRGKTGMAHGNILKRIGADVQRHVPWRRQRKVDLLRHRQVRRIRQR